MASSSSSWSSRKLVVSTTTTTQQCWAAPPLSSPALFVDVTRNNVKTYYGETLSTSADLLTNACCTTTGGSSSFPPHLQAAMSRLHPDTIAKYYGCGLCLPDYDLTGLHVLDLGCGAGRDVYLASQLVGPTGSVVGVDMTVAQLDAARDQQSYHANQFGYDNVEFVLGYLEDLDTVLMTPPPTTGPQQQRAGTFDLIISNCVLNLCTDKAKVLSHCYNLLKEGGELYFSDVYVNRRIPAPLREDPILYGECLSGALYWNDFHNLAQRVGFADPRLVEDSPITIQNKKVQEKVMGYDFYSATYRLWKRNDLEPDCEDYGQAVIYKGGITTGTQAGRNSNNPIMTNNNDHNNNNVNGSSSLSSSSSYSSWKLDKGHVFVQGKVHPVCGNTYNMLRHDKIASHFDFIGDFSTHYGIFDGCAGPIGMPYNNPAKSSSSSSASSCC